MGSSFVASKAFVVVASGAVTVLALAGCSGSTSGSGGSASASATSASAAASASASSSASGTPVPAAELAALVSNTTHSGTDQGAPYSEYYAADGKVSGTKDGTPYTGTWKVSNDELCFTYADDSGASQAPADCYTARADGATVYWYQDGTLSSTTTSVPGNPQNL